MEDIKVPLPLPMFLGVNEVELVRLGDGVLIRADSIGLTNESRPPVKCKAFLPYTRKSVVLVVDCTL